MSQRIVLMSQAWWIHYGLFDIHPQLKQGDSLVQPSMPEGDDSENRLTSHHLSYPDGRRYAATAYPTKRIIDDKQPKSIASLHPSPEGRGFTDFFGNENQ